MALGFMSLELAGQVFMRVSIVPRGLRNFCEVLSAHPAEEHELGPDNIQTKPSVYDKATTNIDRILAQPFPAWTGAGVIHQCAYAAVQAVYREDGTPSPKLFNLPIPTNVERFAHISVLYTR